MIPMTAGSRIVFAVAFVQALDRGATKRDAATWAAAAVKCLHKARLEVTEEPLDEVSAMLDDMLAPDSGLFCASGALAMFEPGKAPCLRCGRAAIEHRSSR